MSAFRSVACIAGALALPFFAPAEAAPDGAVDLAPHAKHGQTSLTVVEWLKRGHLIRKPLDDAASSDTFDRYLDLLDPRRVHFLAEDIQELEQYRFVLDDALKAGELEPAFDIYNRFHERMIERLAFALASVEGGVDSFDFSLDEAIEIDRTKAAWPLHEDAAHDLWRRSVKGAVLNMKLNGREDAEIQDLLSKRYRNRLRQARQVTSEDAFGVYVNAYATTYDRHTEYFSPRISENFSINMSLSLEGIGAVLGGEDEYTSVVRLLPAGPADKGGQLKPADRIVAVGQGRHGTLIDVIGMRLDDVVELIRGPKGSVVRLQVIPATAGDVSETRVVAITRNTVRLEEQSAQSEVLTVHDGLADRRIGVVSVPTFYIDFKARQQGRPDYRSTTRDVQRLIDELKQQDVDGIVVDLRNNGGGSLEEASSLAGLFIASGPTVQVKAARREARVQSDNDDGLIAWEGPMAVLVNRFSASASEIFAGAIQDYGRGIVTGDRTFGKGTVQTLIELDRGQLKMTQAKFYRISGLSPQSQGVTPDIRFPELPGADRFGHDEDETIGRDRVEPVHYRLAGKIDHPLLGTLRQRHDERVADDAEFNYLRARADRSRERTERTHISLVESERLTQKESDDDWALTLENSLLVARGEEPAASLDELRERQGETLEEGEKEPDPLLDETAHILADFIGLTRHVAMLPSAAATTTVVR